MSQDVKLPSLDNQEESKEFNGKTGRWTKDEHIKFLEAIQKYGRNWRKVQEHVGTRSSTQSRSHAQKFFKKVKFEDVEEELTRLKSGSKAYYNSQNEGSASDSDAESAILV